MDNAQEQLEWARVLLGDENTSPEQIKKVVGFLQEASDQGHAEAAFWLAWIYHFGHFGLNDKQKARELYSKAIERDYPHPGAIFNLAYMYHFGELGEPDKQKAHELYEKASGFGHAVASFNLGLMYLVGELGAPDDEKASHWLKIAEDQGYPKAAAFMPSPLIIELRAKLAKSGIDTDLSTKVISALKEIERQFNAIRDKHLVTGRLELSHFTDWKALETLLAVPGDDKAEQGRNVLRKYHVDYMNDPSEGQRLLSFKPKDSSVEPEATAESVSKRLAEIFEKHYQEPIKSCEDSQNLLPSVFITSLTRDSDQLDLWRAYGRDGAGFCISFEVDAEVVDEGSKRRHDLAGHLGFMMEEAKPDALSKSSSVSSEPPLLYEIKYLDDDVIEALNSLDAPLRKVERLYKKVQNLEIRKDIYTCLAAILLELLYLYKDEQYSTEREVRALRILKIDDPRVKSDERNPGRLYVETNPFLFRSRTRIVIGPKAPDKMPALWNLRWRLSKLGYADRVCVTESKVQYR